mmetsp:Transcript_35982/g.117569  ORF Transcript_35982/g.117569 Transcript_35982/m.117569 type:complete len:140 (+) Transcript_35982:268-687(+)
MHWHGRDAMHQPNATAAGASPPASRCGWPALVSPPLSASPSPAIRLWDRPAPVPVVSSEEAAAAAAKTPREPLPTFSSDEAGEAARRWEAAVGAAKAARADADSDEQAQAAAAKRKACDVASAEGNEERPAKLSREVLV